MSQGGEPGSESIQNSESSEKREKRGPEREDKLVHKSREGRVRVGSGQQEQQRVAYCKS